MKRRGFTNLMGAAGLAASCSQTLAAKFKRPNLLIIQTDEHNFRTLGCYRETLSKDQALMWGEAIVETPHIDRIAHEGALCTRFYATTPVCSPSRGSFMSGLYPQNSPVTNNNMPFSGVARGIAVVFQDMGKGHHVAI